MCIVVGQNTSRIIFPNVFIFYLEFSATIAAIELLYGSPLRFVMYDVYTTQIHHELFVPSWLFMYSEAAVFFEVFCFDLEHMKQLSEVLRSSSEVQELPVVECM